MLDQPFSVHQYLEIGCHFVLSVRFLLIFASKSWENVQIMDISKSIWSVHHPDPGQNSQHIMFQNYHRNCKFKEKVSLISDVTQI